MQVSALAVMVVVVAPAVIEITILITAVVGMFVISVVDGARAVGILSIRFLR